MIVTVSVATKRRLKFYKGVRFDVYLVYVENDNLYLLDMEEKNTVLIDENVERVDIMISMNGGAVLYSKKIMSEVIGVQENYICVNGESHVFAGCDVVSLTDEGEGYCGINNVYYFYPDGNKTLLAYSCYYNKAINLYGNQLMYYDFTKGCEGLYIATEGECKKIEKDNVVYYFDYYGRHNKVIPQYLIRLNEVEFSCEYTYNESLYNSYIGGEQFDYIDKNGKLEKIADVNAICFAAPEKTDYVYYSAWI